MLEQKVAKVTKRGESWVQGGGGSGREKSEAVLPMTAGESEPSVQRRLGGRRPEKHVAKSCQKSAKKLPKSATFRERRERCKYPLNHELPNQIFVKKFAPKRSAVANESGASGRKPVKLPWSKLSGPRVRGRLCRVETGLIEES